MKIPKQKVIEYKLDGVTYLKTEDIRFPLLTYILSWPLRRIRIIHFQLRTLGILKIPNTEAHETDLKHGQVKTKDSKKTVEVINIGKPIESTKDATISYQGDQKFGEYSIKFEYIDNEVDFGSDVLEFTFEDDQGEILKVYHTPEYFLQLMFSDNLGLSGKFISDANNEELDVFKHNLLIHDAKSLVDDRAYQNIQVSGHDIEVRLKYIGLRIYLAAIHDDSENITALLTDVMCEGDFLEPFILKISLSNIFESSTTVYDSEEQSWVGV